MGQVETVDQPMPRAPDSARHQDTPAPANALEVRVENDFDFLSPEYHALFEQAGATPFQAPEWLAAVYQQLAPAASASALIVTVRAAASGQLVMVLPLVHRRVLGLKVIEFADLGVTDYAAPVVMPGAFERFIHDRAIKSALKQALGQHDILRIRHIRHGSPHAGELFDGVRVTAMSSSAHYIALTGCFKSWQSQVLNRKLQKSLSKSRFALSLEGTLAVDIIECPREITATFLTLRQFRASRSKSRSEDDLLQNEAYFNFYLDMAIKGASQGFARTMAIKLNGRTIAVLFGLKHGDAFLYLLSGADFDNFGQYSPGNLMIEDAIRISHELGERFFDFTVGDEPHKMRFGTRPIRIDVAWKSNSLAGHAAGFIVNEIDWLRPYLRRFARPV